jgi:hypothetical protein
MAAIQVADPVSGDAGDFHFELVAGRFQIVQYQPERRGDERAVILAVDFYPRALAVAARA